MTSNWKTTIPVSSFRREDNLSLCSSGFNRPLRTGAPREMRDLFHPAPIATALALLFQAVLGQGPARPYCTGARPGTCRATGRGPSRFQSRRTASQRTRVDRTVPARRRSGLSAPERRGLTIRDYMDDIGVKRAFHDPASVRIDHRDSFFECELWVRHASLYVEPDRAHTTTQVT